MFSRTNHHRLLAPPQLQKMAIIKAASKLIASITVTTLESVYHFVHLDILLLSQSFLRVIFNAKMSFCDVIRI